MCAFVLFVNSNVEDGPNERERGSLMTDMLLEFGRGVRMRWLTDMANLLEVSVVMNLMT